MAPKSKKAKTGKAADLVQDGSLASLINVLTKVQTVEKRDECVEQIVELLEKSQSQFCSPAEESTGLEKFACTDLVYTIKRLVKGSASLNSGTRSSFSTALKAVLDKFKAHIPLAEIFFHTTNLLSTQNLYGSNNPSRGEESAVNCAKVAAFDAIVSLYGEEVKDLGEKKLGAIISSLADISHSRAFLGVPAFEILLTLQSILGTDWQLKISESIKESPAGADLIWFLVKSQLPVDLYPETIKAHAPLLASTAYMTEKLMDTISFMEEPHQLWSVVIDNAISVGKLDEFLLEHLDKQLFDSDSVQKKILGAKLMIMVVQKRQTIPVMQHFMELLNVVLPKPNRKGQADLPLNKAIHEFVEFLVSDESLTIQDEFAEKLFSLQNFRRFPHGLKIKVLEGEERIKKYFESVKTVFGKAEGSIQISLSFDAMADISAYSMESDLKKGLCKEIISIAVSSIAKDEISKKAISPRFQTFMSECIATFGLKELLQLVGKQFKSVELGDEILEEASKKIAKTLKKIDQGKPSGSEELVIVEALELYLLLAKVWLHFDPLLVADTVDDVDEALQRCLPQKKKSKKKESDDEEDELSTLDFTVDICLKLLSSSSAFLKSCCDIIVKPIIPFMCETTIDLMIEILTTKSKTSMQDDLMEDIEEEDEQEDEDEEMEESNEDSEGSDDSEDSEDSESSDEEDSSSENLKRSFSALANAPEQSDDEDEEESDVVYLDDADEAELAMYDQKLSEIFKHKKEAKLSVKLSAQATLHFKARLLHWIRLMLDPKSQLQFPIRVHLLASLIKALAINVAEDTDGLSIVRNITEIIKSSAKKGPVENLPEAEEKFNTLAAEIVSEYWENQLIWNHAQCILAYLLKIGASEKALIDHLKACWTAARDVKKVQKSRFPDYFSLWTVSQPNACWELVNSNRFFEELASELNAHARGIIVTFLKTLLNQQQQSQSRVDSELAGKIFELVKTIKSGMDAKALKSKAWKDSVSLFAAVLRKTSLAEKDQKAVEEFLGTLDAGSKSSIMQAMKKKN